jgi:hypothetical protein
MKMPAIALGAALVLVIALLGGCSGSTGNTGTDATGTWGFGATTLVRQDAGGPDITVTGGALNLRSLASAAANIAAAQFTDSESKVRSFSGSYVVNGSQVSGSGLTGADGTLSFVGAVLGIGVMTGTLEYRDSGGVLYRGNFEAAKVTG